jgi:hypothetical protein
LLLCVNYLSRIRITRQARKGIRKRKTFETIHSYERLSLVGSLQTKTFCSSICLSAVMTPSLKNKSTHRFYARKTDYFVNFPRTVLLHFYRGTAPVTLATYFEKPSGRLYLILVTIQIDGTL